LLHILEGKIHLAPVENPATILDIGTGTGIWAIDASEKFPDAEVTGTDISPIQPGWVPPNCRFEIEDAEQAWTFNSNAFDFIHLRNLIQSISNWGHVLSEVYRCTKPGGWIEHAELTSQIFSDDGTEGPAFRNLIDMMQEGMKKIGRILPDQEILVENIKKAGFVEVQLVVKRQPFGLWPKDPRMKRTGSMALLMAETGVEAYTLAVFSRVFGIPAEEVKRMCDDARKEMRNPNNHMYCEFLIVYGRKLE